MFDYAICDISGKQYKVLPNKAFEVDFLGEDQKNVDAQVLLLSEGNKIKLGTPFLKEKLTLDVLGTERGDKIRVAKFHAKANYRRVKGFRSKLTKVVYSVKNDA